MVNSEHGLIKDIFLRTIAERKSERRGLFRLMNIGQGGESGRQNVCRFQRVGGKLNRLKKNIRCGRHTKFIPILIAQKESYITAPYNR